MEATIKPQSAKAKGRNLQKLVRDKVLNAFKNLTSRDVQSTSMGASGVDVKLSEAAFRLFPYAVECKSLAKVAVYRFYEQREPNSDGETLVIVKENGKQPLAIVSLDHFMELVKCQNKT